MREVAKGKEGIAVISERQIETIWALARKLGLCDEGSLEMMKGHTGKDLVDNLTVEDVRSEGR
jgi:hypothetical protein